MAGPKLVDPRALTHREQAAGAKIVEWSAFYRSALTGILANPANGGVEISVAVAVASKFADESMETAILKFGSYLQPEQDN